MSSKYIHSILTTNSMIKNLFLIILCIFAWPNNAFNHVSLCCCPFLNQWTEEEKNISRASHLKIDDFWFDWRLCTNERLAENKTQIDQRYF